MTISRQGILDLEGELNDILEQDCAELHFTFHASVERINDPRNNPAISLAELEEAFKDFIKAHLNTILAMPDGTLFTLTCNKSKLNFPCSISHDMRIGRTWVVQSVITAMRKADFKSKDSIILQIN